MVVASRHKSRAEETINQTKKNTTMTKFTYNFAITILILLNLIILILFVATSNEAALYMMPFGVFVLCLVIKDAIQHDKKTKLN